jgi:O-antigen/teichoic acid export membrane protein
MDPGTALLISLYIVLYNHYLFCLIINQAGIKPLRYVMIEGTYHLLWLGGFLLLTLVLGWKIYLTLFVAMIAGLIITETARILILPGKFGLTPALIRFDHALGKRAFRFGFPITIWLFLAYLVTVSDRFVITEMLGYKDAGTYSAVKDFIIKIATFSTMPILLVYHPAIVSRWNGGDKKEALRMIGRGVGYSLVIAVAAGAGYLLFSGFFYTRVMHITVEHQLSVSVLLMLSAFLWQISMLVHKPLELLLKPGLMLLAIAIALIFNVIANLILVPVAGYPAAAIVSLLSVILYLSIVGGFLYTFSRKGMLI